MDAETLDALLRAAGLPARRRHMPAEPSRKGPKPQRPERVPSVRLYLTITPPEAAKLARLAEREGVPPATVAYRILSAGIARKR